jgi:hypothetical protein
MEYPTMKLLTSIPLRRDGTVRAAGPDGQPWVFRVAEGEAEPSCDVDDPDSVAALLATEQFYPANPDDYGAARSMLGQADAADADAEGNGDADDDAGDADDPQGAAALPVEANTPPSPARARKPRAAPAER